MSKILQKLALAQKVDKAAGGITVSSSSGTNVRTSSAGQSSKRLASNSSAKKADKKKALTKTGPIDSKVIYLGHIPNGFYEVQMRSFFSQFGLVKRLKLFRSAKTNNPKGYAFIEFESSEIANVVSDAMNGYYMMERQLVSNVVDPTKIHDGLFKPPKKRTLIEVNGTEEGDEEEDNEKEDRNIEKVFTEHKRSLRNKQKRLKELGIDFDVSIPN